MVVPCAWLLAIDEQNFHAQKTSLRPEPHELSFHYTPALPKNPAATPRLSGQVREPEEQSFLTPRKRRNRDRAARDGGGEHKPNTSFPETAHYNPAGELHDSDGLSAWKKQPEPV